MVFYGGGYGMGGYGMARLYTPQLEPMPTNLDSVFRTEQGLAAQNGGGPLANALNAAVQFPIAMAGVRKQQAGQSALNNLAATGQVTPDLPVNSINDANRAFQMQSQAQQDASYDQPYPPAISHGLAQQVARLGFKEPPGGFTPRTAQVPLRALQMTRTYGKPSAPDPLTAFLQGKGGQQEPQAGQSGQQPAPQAAPVGQTGKVRVIAPDGRSGSWDLSKGPIPQGFRRQ